ncbi:hypothetical protein GQX73_g4459 [Xylaria multiplex]|uniref:Uncharacterized protein n=1 Tax=Xylaria multiplex TaxID=323545 RepID=A0A7C8MZ29_9PEZI|nr:hypothetical protein GQX73_g4459 [Xylaria multiplex]
MGNQKEAETFTESTDGLPPPPPYQEADYSTNVHLSSEPAPSYDVGESSSSISGVKCGFPPTLNAYLKMGFTKTFHLGQTKESPAFAARMHSGLTKNPELVLYDGPSERGSILATADHESIWRSNSVLTVPAREGVDHDSESQKVIMTSHRSLRHQTYKFTANVGVGKETRSEEFEWRSSHGSEVRELDGYRWGWKLVRLSGQTVGSGGDRATRETGSTSDGFEVVAAWAHNNSLSMTKAFKFQLMGSALTGMLGDRGATLALISAMRIWAIELATSSATAAAAS